ncbi:hypothetical protein AB0J83_42330 [Actinoplanes sp. NPDC049596]|uniref:hypothetical protein n=1 Tax=unclassified Actinoplanes TaxID=2626549 RepID=UPI00341C0D4E
MSVQVHIPASYITSGWGTPSVCARHGEPAVEHKKTRFISRVQGWAYLLLLAGALPFLIFVLATRKTVEAAAWPFCARCARDRKKGLAIGLALLAVGVVGIFLASAVPDAAAGLVAIVAVVALVAGYIVALRSASRMLVAGGQADERGQFVTFRKAHEAFAAQATAALHAAAQHHAAQAAQFQAAQAAQAAQFQAAQAAQFAPPQHYSQHHPPQGYVQPSPPQAAAGGPVPTDPPV